MDRLRRVRVHRYVLISVIIAGSGSLAACSESLALPTSLHGATVHRVADAVKKSRPTAPRTVATSTEVLHPVTKLPLGAKAPVMSTAVPGAPDCPMFPADNIWNTNISRLPVDSHSGAWLRS